MALNIKVYKALQLIATSPDSILDAALTVFNPEEVADKASVLKQLVLSFGTDEDLHLQKISFQ